MGQWLRRLVWLLWIPFFASADPLSREELSRLSFAGDKVESASTTLARRSVGALMEGVTGFGVSFSEPLRGRYSVWSTLMYTPKVIVSSAPGEGGQTLTVGQQINGWLGAFGVNAIYNPLNRRYWMLVLGSGLAYRQRDFKTKTFREDRGTFLDHAWHENEFQIYGKMGLHIRGVRLVGQPAQATVSLMMPLTRMVLNSPPPSSPELDHEETPWYFELSLEI